jgi:endoglucanase
MRLRRSLATCLLLAAVAACTSSSDEPDDAQPDQQGGEDGPALGGERVTDGTGAAIEVQPSLETPGTIVVAVEAPSGATEMQLSVDPTYGDDPWQPVQPQLELPSPDAGYVQVFARFRAGDADPSASLVAGLVLDAGWASATTTNPAHRSPTLVGMAAPTTLMVRVEAGRVVRSGHEDYDFAAPVAGDQISTGDGGLSVVTRDGELYGTQVATGVNAIYRPDELVGGGLDGAVFDDAGGFRISSEDDDAYGSGKEPEGVLRVTRPYGSAVVGPDEELNGAAHDVYLRLPSAPTPGATYTIAFPDDVVAPATFTFDPLSSRSPAVHANQLGFKPGDSLKVAYVSAWAGEAVEQPADLPFRVVDVADDSVVLEGTATERTTGPDGERGTGDLTGTSVLELDFSELDEPGDYRVCADGLGCSYEFSLSDTSTWRRAAVAVARSVYHQRSGVALEEPYTSVVRPRGFHPDDGIVVHQSTASEAEVATAFENGQDGFAQLTDQGTDEAVDGAWGGHFDAGDWDRRIYHLSYLRSALDLVEMYPDTWADLDLGIPESGDAIPDIIDEGLWDLDFYVRLQSADGGVRGGVESSEHPQGAETSWTQTQEVFAYAPDARSSYMFAGVAAETARVLEAYDAARAAGYRDAAVAAITFAEANPTAGIPEGMKLDEVRAAAGAAVYRLTGDETWHEVFLDASAFADGPVDLLACEALYQCDAGWIYANTEQPGVDATVKENVLESFRANAEAVLASQDSTLFGWSMEHPEYPLVWGLGPSVPKTMGLLRAYALTDDAALCQAAQRAVTFSLGANPLDTVFLTGIGEQNVRNPLVIDSIRGGLPIWPGTPVFGLHRLNGTADESWVAEFKLRPSGATPDPESVPFTQSYWDVEGLPMMSEYTIHQTHAFALFAYGSLAGLDC